MHPAVIEGALFHAQAQVARHQRLVRLDEHVEHGTVQVSDAAAHLDDVAETLGRDGADLGAALGDEGVGAQGGAVHDLLHACEELVEALAVVAGGLAHGSEKAFGRILRRGGGLEPVQLARLLEDKTVGEGAADVNGQLLHWNSSDRASTGNRSMFSVSSFITGAYLVAGGAARSRRVAASSTCSVLGSITTP